MFKITPHTEVYMDTIVKVLDDMTAIDANGNDVTNKVPSHARKRALQNDCALRLAKTKTGKTQWRDTDLADYEALANQAVPTKKVNNVKNELENDVVDFLSKCEELKPDHLIVSSLKWKYLMRSVLRGKNILMTGPSGCGKTLAAQTVAGALDGRQFFYFNIGATQDPRSTLIGNTHYSKDRGTFVAEALFVKAIQTPNSIILLDELTRGHSDAWNILMTVLDENQRYLRIDEMPETPTIKVAKGVTFIATANIGAEYTATRVLDRAMLDRFASIVEMEPLSKDDELNLLMMTYPDVDVKYLQSIAEIADHTRQQVKSEDPKVTTSISSRITVEMAGLLNDGFSLAETAEACIFPFFSNAGGNDSERTYMKQLVQKYLPVEGGAGTPWETLTKPEDQKVPF
jgi:nitric oxide reductase NorQ protein